GGSGASARNVISGNSSAGVDIYGPGTSFNVVRGNFIGLDPTGTVDLGNAFGVWIEQGATQNLVGGSSAASRNVISGNSNSGVSTSGTATSGNAVWGNFIGLNRMGTAALGNFDGVDIQNGATHNDVGGSPLSRNVISGNHRGGVFIYATGTVGNAVLGN